MKIDLAKSFVFGNFGELGVLLFREKNNFDGNSLSLKFAGTKKMTKFSKSDDCPSSQELNAFEQGEIALEDGRAIRQHLRACEFCAAESDFYARFPQPLDIEPAELPENNPMPQPLRELAESMLNKHHGSSALESLLRTENRR